MSERVNAISRYILNLLFEFVPLSFHGLFSALGTLLIVVGLVSNWLESDIPHSLNPDTIYFVAGGDPFILTGYVFISLGIMIYIINALMR